MNKPAVLSEEWLPLAELGIESRRENSTGQHPPPNRLHVWWARRPLTVSRAAVLGGLLPAWSEDWPEELKDKFPDQKAYAEWFLRLIGILGDPIEAREKIKEANKQDIRLKQNPYGYKRAFQQTPSEDKLTLFWELLEQTWDSKDINLCDPMAGGGSIPLEALRYGIGTYANDLNPVAAILLKTTLEYPIKYGKELLPEIEKYGALWADRVRKRLEDFYPVEEGNSIHAYLWARTVPCPSTGKPVPLSPNWWLRKGSNPVAVRPVCEDSWDECRFEILRGQEAGRSKPNDGTVSRGVGRSPWTGETIPLEYIHTEGKEGRIGQQLYAVAIKQDTGMDFRAPTPKDLNRIQAAEKEFRERLPSWEYQNLIPNESIPPGYTTAQPMRYGITSWRQMFSPRQLLAQCTFLDTLKDIQAEIAQDVEDATKAEAIATCLGLALDKTADYNSRMVWWHSSRGVITHTFDRHEFSFKWSHAEFDAAHNLLPWTLEQVLDAYEGICDLAEPLYTNCVNDILPGLTDEKIIISQRNASSLTDIPDASLHTICVDPPYYDNVFYSESSDFFYVWMKRALGDIHPEFFQMELTNKDEEAVANPARFADLEGSKKKELAKQDYERKMAAAFREMHRVLRPDGVLTVMFTHKQTEAWNTLAKALIEAGFSIQASWPVHTESRHSLHQASKNAAASTILLVCRKREASNERTWWEDLRGEVQQTVRQTIEEFQAQGIEGVDLQLSTFGPTLAVISEHWPVLTSKADPDTGDPVPLEPEAALDIAREEIFAMRKRRLLGGRAIQFDPITDWYIMAWDTFSAQQFPADEARKLAMSMNLDIETDLSRGKKVIRKRGRFVLLRTPDDRTFKGLVDPDREEFDCLLDALHTAMLLYEEDGSGACRRFLEIHNLLSDTTFKALIQALLHAIPRLKDEGEFVREEAAILDTMRLAFFDDLEVPETEEETIDEAMSVRQLAGEE